MNRKDQHIKYALIEHEQSNSFDDVELMHASIPQYDLSEIDITTELCGYKLTSPFFINAMTGGSKNTQEINKKLAIIAKECDLLLFTGSFSSALKDSNNIDSFTVIRDIAPNILIGTNIGLDKTYQDALIAIKTLNANILQVHLNLAQELIMPEGDRNFNQWQSNLTKIIKNVTIPIIVKETGFGMSAASINQLINLGVKTIDISGKGGTNFAFIENQRRTSHNQINYLNDWGLSTVISLLEAQKFMCKVDIVASGGIRNPLDIIKSLVLGAKAVGIAGSILKMLHQYDLDSTINLIKNWQQECKIIMCLLNCNSIEQLTNTRYFLKNNSWHYYQQTCK